MNKQIIALKQETASLDISRVAPVIAALIVGAFLLLAAGFSHSNTIHNAAHDARHAFAVPCH
jgi:cobalt transporter subunit CbtB